MNILLKKTILLILYCVLAISASAQYPYIFYPLQIKQGLSSNKTNALLLDKQGYVWVTTENGLNRYDGHRFRRYYSSFDQKNLFANYTWGLNQDGNGVIWVGMKEFYYTLYYPGEDRFDKNWVDYVRKLGFKGDVSNCSVDVDDNGNLWMYNTKGVDHYNFSLKKWRHYNIPNVNCIYIKGNSAYVIQADLSINIISFRKNNITTDKSLQSESVNFKNDYPFLFVDSKGGMWVFSFRHDKLYHKEKGAAEWHKFQSDDGSGLDVYNLDEDPYGTVLIAMGHKSLCYYDRISNSIEQYDATHSRLLNGVINDVKVLGKTVWICYDNQGLGVAFMPITGMEMRYIDSPQFNSLRYADCTAVAYDAAQNIWFGTNGNGLYVVSKNHEIIQHYNFQDKLNSAMSIYIDRKNRAWVSAYNDGLYIFESPSATPLHIRNGENGLRPDNIKCLGTDTKGNIWAALSDGGMQKWDETKKTFCAPILTSMYIRDLQWIGTNEFIIATSDGHYEFDAQTGKASKCPIEAKAFAKYHIVDKTINCIFYDSRKWFWEAGNGGIIITDGKNRSVYIGKDNGLCNQVILGIAEDLQHNIWVTTENGVCRIIIPKGGAKLDPSTFKLQNFSIYDGLKSNFSNHKAIVNALDNIVIGSPSGINVIKTDQLPDMRKRSRVFVTELAIGSDSVCAAVDTTVTYRIPSNESIFKVRFSLLNDDEAKDFIYAYRLSGWKDWEYTNNTELTFSHLKPGHYTIEICLQAEADDDTGLITHLNVFVCYPWYESWWFITLLIMVIAAGCYLTYSKRKKFYEIRQQLTEIQNERDRNIERKESERLIDEITESDIEVANADDVLKTRTVAIIEKNIDNTDFTVEQLSQELGMSRANLHRRLVAIAGQGPLGFIRTVRLQHAQHLLLKSQMTVAEISYAVGINNPKNFTKYFKEEFGVTPSQYREDANASKTEINV